MVPGAGGRAERCGLGNLVQRVEKRKGSRMRSREGVVLMCTCNADPGKSLFTLLQESFHDPLATCTCECCRPPGTNQRETLSCVHD